MSTAAQRRKDSVYTDTFADTPTHTTDTLSGPGLEGLFSVDRDIESVPWPGRTYVIRHRTSDKVLAREYGCLVLKEAGELATCGWYWACFEHSEGWLGFRETISGFYLGRYNKGGFGATASKHNGWEFFDARKHPDGGYQLLSIHWKCRMRMAADMETQRVVEIAGSGDECDEATLWNFVEV
jgi:hypothetical protein